MDHPIPRILIVEDDQRLAELTAEYLQANGFEAVSYTHLRAHET